VEALGLVLLLLLALALRMYALGSQSVWIDEAYSLELAEKSLPAIVAETARDNHPPLYYLLLAAWVRLGSAGEGWARALSVLFGLVLVASFYWFCRQISNRATSMIAAGLLAVSPLAIWHSQDARMYALMLATMYLALALFLHYLEKGSPASLALFTLLLAGSFYTHVYSLFALPVLAAHLLWSRRETPAFRTRRASVALGIAALFFLPWVFVVMASAMHEAGFYKPIGLFTVPYTFYAFSVGYSLGPSVADLHTLWQGFAVLSHLGAGVFLTAVFFGAAVLAGIAKLPSLPRRFSLLVACLLVLPVLLAIGVTLFTRVDFNARYAILGQPAYLLIVAMGLLSLRPRALRLLVGAGLLSVTAASLFNYYTNTAYAKEDTRSAYRLIEETWEPGDCVYVIGVDAAFRYYARGSAIQFARLDFRTARHAAREERTLERSTRVCRRIWFVAGREWEADPLGLAVPTLLKFFEATGESKLQGVRLLEMRPRAQTALPGA
jgi:4-amino-4-deoxy-L-arabinose transferase-like glycosyltransferase